ncbi:hypothetical protein PENTCL1PPCAC_17193, partial [Pristionchus entomophagus]
QAVFVICALPVVVILIYLLPKIALHDNCSIISHGSFIVCDLVSGRYIPITNSDPAVQVQ